MIAIVLHKKIVMGKKYIGFSICDIGFSLWKAIRSIDPFQRIFHQGSPSSNKVNNIQHQWGYEEVFTNGLNNGIYVMNKETIIVRDKDIITKLFELSGQYEMLY